MKQIAILLISLMLSFETFAQVKIGDNPNTINTNSMLELESTNKGFLPPRVALTSVNSTTPLTSTTPTGMIVYSLGGSITDGYYYWSGVKWLGLSTSSSTRSNYVLVKSASDFPAAVSGVITLSANTLYEINGVISLTDKIDLNGNTLVGMDHMNDKLLYTPSSGELFTGSNGGTIKMVTLSAPSSQVFNLDAGNANKNIILQSVMIYSCNSVGTIKGFGGETFLEDVMFSSNTNGIKFEDDSQMNLINLFWDPSNSNVFEKYTGTFTHIRKVGGDAHALTANSAIALDVTGITSIIEGDLKGTLFLGNGTYVNGSFSSNWEVEANGINTEKDDVASGNIYISSTAITTFVSANNPVKIAGTTTSANLFRITAPTNNRLTCATLKTKRFKVICSLTGTQTSSNIVYSFYIAKNGTILPESKQKVKVVNSTDQQSVTLSCTVLLAPGDYIEVKVENNTNTTALTVQTMNVAIN